ncbi:hypothetical protein INR49_026403 [Caranx melampygus]|nr:hypothetical protein INR49_026403 [Caranx melampygus]
MMRTSCLDLLNQNATGEEKAHGDVLLERLFTETDAILSPGPLKSSHHLNDNITKMETTETVLMALYPMEHPFELVLLTKICLIISILCLILSILTFKFCRSIQGTRTTIHLPPVREEYAHFLSCICTTPKKRYSDLSTTNPSSSQSQASRSGDQTGESQI